MILTIDFGTTVTKVGLWGDGGVVALAAPGAHHHAPQHGLERTGPAALVDHARHRVCAEARAQAPLAFGDVDVVGARAHDRPSSR